MLTMSKYMGKHIDLAHKVVIVGDRSNRKTCVTLLRIKVYKLESSYCKSVCSEEISREEISTNRLCVL